MSAMPPSWLRLTRPAPPLPPTQSSIEELELRYDAAMREYHNQSEHRMATFQQLSRNDAGAAKVIEERMKKLAHLQVGGRAGGRARPPAGWPPQAARAAGQLPAGVADVAGVRG
jgi:hypothetical protein